MSERELELELELERFRKWMTKFGDYPHPFEAWQGAKAEQSAEVQRLREEVKRLELRHKALLKILDESTIKMVNEAFARRSGGDD